MPPSDIVTIDYLFLGHPRCGSAALAAGLTEAGLPVGHERLEDAGMVSWWHTGFHAQGHRFGKSSQTFPALNVGRILHYLRRPADALPSIEIENEQNGRDNNSFRHRARVIKQTYGVDLAELTPPQAAAASYALWNRLAASISDADTPILVEKPDFSIVSPDLHAEALPVRNTTQKKFGVKKAERDLDYFLADAPADIRDAIEAAEALYS